MINHPGECVKAPHKGDGYLHDEHDERPYDVDGVEYCGRCHAFTGRASTVLLGTARLVDNHSTPADLETDRLRAEVADLKAERECILATRKWWPFSEREMIRKRDLAACRVRAEERNQFVADLQDDLEVLRAQMNEIAAALDDDREDDDSRPLSIPNAIKSLRAALAEAKIELEEMRAAAVEVGAEAIRQMVEADANAEVASLRAALAEATQTERERCAKVAETTHCAAIGPGSGCCSWRAAHDAVAAAIRGTK